jgi:hypothetical protein
MPPPATHWTISVLSNCLGGIGLAVTGVGTDGCGGSKEGSSGNSGGIGGPLSADLDSEALSRFPGGLLKFSGLRLY